MSMSRHNMICENSYIFYNQLAKMIEPIYFKSFGKTQNNFSFL
ncbi:conserved hypothetical protein [Leptospira interrogans serovar Manilae]|uniref:Uncharacterized protein n=1 Tax=Leptospira interrogans serovar Manilae TaxID=214675 RepID=A0AAQ1SMG0_LEPIR|nr:hypothetical protein LEP1GSC109_2568 [Leptospira interrogans str. UI 13372]SOR60293.1 conserved hypothetical protein [Leptospira interrogans serovar Manilae]